ncbi:hypothetical protein C8J57DRAFT_1525586 [Mycena rebaudengoi]|nr:hypothetical protein C8J57DRAFT_1525586 [Mycena rebaudengoi]
MDTFYDKSAAKKSIERLGEYMAHHQLTLKEDYCIGPAHLIEDAKIAQRIAEAKAKKTSQTDVDKDMGNNKRRLVFDDQDEVERVGSLFPFENMVDAIGDDE